MASGTCVGAGASSDESSAPKLRGSSHGNGVGTARVDGPSVVIVSIASVELDSMSSSFRLIVFAFGFQAWCVRSNKSCGVMGAGVLFIGRRGREKMHRRVGSLRAAWTAASMLHVCAEFAVRLHIGCRTISLRCLKLDVTLM